MTPAAISRKVGELNIANENSLPTEWEIMLAAAASRLCSVEYEPDLGGRRRADLLVMPGGPGTPGCLVEITAISDEHAHRENPYDAVCSDIRRRLRKLEVPKGGWNIQVEGKNEGPYRDAKMRLMLGSGRATDLFDDAFHGFIRAVKEAPTERRVHEWRGDRLDMTLTFDPLLKHQASGHLVYTVVHSLKRNPLANALDAKSKQLRQTGHPGPYGVVVCDGGCDVLSSRLTAGGSSFSVRDILCEHFRSNPRLSFVLVLYIETRPPSFLGPSSFHQVLRALPCFRENAPRLAMEALDRLTRAATSLPQPLASPANAVRCYVRQQENEWWHFPGGSVTMSENSIKLSSRALLEMLAVHKTPADLFVAIGNDGFFPGNHFDRQRAEGRCITGVRLTKGPGDDDEIEFVFGSPDAAATTYRLPKHE